MKIYETLQETLQDLRRVSRDWSDTEEVLEILNGAKDFLRFYNMTTNAIFDVYDDVVMSIGLIEMEDEDEKFFDGRVFTLVLTRLGFKDIY